jgi:hypothetical protein
MKIQLAPELNRCIETVARKEFEDTSQKILSSDEPQLELADKAEIIKLFLEKADFKRLRVESEKYLIKGNSVIFTVYLEGDRLKYEMDVRIS